MIRGPPKSTQSRSSAASDVYKRQLKDGSSVPVKAAVEGGRKLEIRVDDAGDGNAADWGIIANGILTR